jgi:hypothetical protein
VAGNNDFDHFAVYNSIVQKASSGGLIWNDNGPSNNSYSQCPTADYNLFRPFSVNTETLSYSCGGGGTTFANPPGFIASGTHNKVGLAYAINFTALNPTTYASNDFHLLPGSAAIDAGTYMMRASSGATGTTVSVLGNGGSNDPRNYFIGPASYLDAVPDQIMIAGSDCGARTITAMTSTSISFSGSACTWTTGAGIHLPWSGSAPDMGAFEFGLAGLTPPTLISVEPIAP